MLKRFLSVVAAVTLLLSMCVSAIAVEPRAVGTMPTLTFSGTTANCSVIINGEEGDDIDAVMSLYRGSTLVRSWPGEGTTAIYISGSASGLTKGVAYTLKVTGTVDGVAFSSTPLTKTC